MKKLLLLAALAMALPQIYALELRKGTVYPDFNPKSKTELLEKIQEAKAKKEAISKLSVSQQEQALTPLIKLISTKLPALEKLIPAQSTSVVEAIKAEWDIGGKPLSPQEAAAIKSGIQSAFSEPQQITQLTALQDLSTGLLQKLSESQLTTLQKGIYIFNTIKPILLEKIKSAMARLKNPAAVQELGKAIVAQINGATPRISGQLTSFFGPIKDLLAPLVDLNKLAKTSPVISSLFPNLDLDQLVKQIPLLGNEAGASIPELGQKGYPTTITKLKGTGEVSIPEKELRKPGIRPVGPEVKGYNFGK